ncbi:MAG TPA: 3-keto-5-aminohexanoate cleavage protein [Nevskiaceae bacterium]|nr:3-keto-5-aminohexanoate cleavage protein [Nevskiaceae bacterium]
MTTIKWDKIGRAIEREKHTMVWKPYGFPKIADLESCCYHDAPISERWSGIPEKLIVSVAITGSFFRHEENPHQPVTVDTIRASAREVLLAGASTVHIHVRDDQQYNVLSFDRFKAVVEPLKEEFPDLALDGCLVPGLQGDWAEMKRVLDAKLLHASPVNSTAVYVGDSLMAKPAPILMEKTRLILEAGGVPEIAVYTDADVSNADRYLIRSGLMKTPAVWLILPALPGCSPMDNPRQMVEGLMRMVTLIRDIDPGGTILVCAAGRASMHLATLAASIGLHIRIGMEDTYYAWPHREDRLTSNLQAFKLAQHISEAVGRPIATRAEYRRMIGLPEVAQARAA